MLAGNACMVRNVQHGLESITADRRERAGGWGGGGNGRTVMRWVPTFAALVSAASGCDAKRCRSDAPPALCQETHRRDPVADESSRVGVRLRQRTPIQCWYSQGLSSHAYSNPSPGAPDHSPTRE